MKVLGLEAVVNDDGAEWPITLSGFIERGAHEPFIAGRCGGGNQMIRRNHSSGSQRDNETSPARKVAGAMRTTVTVATSHPGSPFRLSGGLPILRGRADGVVGSLGAAGVSQLKCRCTGSGRHRWLCLKRG